MTVSMGPGKLVRRMHSLSYTYDTYFICMGLGPSILSVIAKSLAYSSPSHASLHVLPQNALLTSILPKMNRVFSFLGILGMKGLIARASMSVPCFLLTRILPNTNRAYSFLGIIRHERADCKSQHVSPLFPAHKDITKHEQGVLILGHFGHERVDCKSQHVTPLFPSSKWWNSRWHSACHEKIASTWAYKCKWMPAQCPHQRCPSQIYAPLYTRLASPLPPWFIQAGRLSSRGEPTTLKFQIMKPSW